MISVQLTHVNKSLINDCRNIGKVALVCMFGDFYDTLVDGNLGKKYDLCDLNDLIKNSNNRILICGDDEPTSHKIDIINMITKLEYELCVVETYGNNMLDILEIVDMSNGKNIKFNYTPKLNTKEEVEKSIILTKELSLYNKIDFRIPIECFNPDSKLMDLTYHYLEEISNIPFNDRVFLTPIMSCSVRKNLFDNSSETYKLCLKFGFNFTFNINYLHKGKINDKKNI